MSQLQLPPCDPMSLLARPQARAIPRLLPAPELRPTTNFAQNVPQPTVLSSPPLSPNADLQAHFPAAVFKTPALPKQVSRDAVLQLSSPPESVEKDPMEDQSPSKELTSSVVRGNAARGLLDLGRRRRE